MQGHRPFLALTASRGAGQAANSPCPISDGEFVGRQRSRIGEESAKAETERGWEEWFSLLDAWGATEKGHAPTAKHLEEAYDLSGWWAQKVTVEFERVRGLREVGQRGDEFVATVQRTIRAFPEPAYAAPTEPDHLSRWFAQDARADVRIGGRYENKDGDRGKFLRLDPPGRIKYTWENPGRAPGTMVEIWIDSKDEARSLIRLEHSRLKNREELEDLRTDGAGPSIRCAPTWRREG
ncbi:MAG: SRPBCC domain-containing protein [Candidatus Thermoplasmatota archaeon]|nr:SRPBCC domain-containing protein [Candidatus Thermoplasmatota archaeon]